jgi:hypothetical protein
MRKLLLAAAALLPAAGPAHAADWWLLTGAGLQCERAQDLATHTKLPEFRSPPALAEATRRSAEFVGETFHKTASGMIDRVTVKIADGGAFFFFASNKICEQQRTVLIPMGYLSEPRELADRAH